LLHGPTDEDQSLMVGEYSTAGFPVVGVKYRMAGPANTIDGRPVFRAVGTDIDWEAIGSDPMVIRENSERVKGRFRPHEGTPHDEPAAVVAYGQSLTETWELLKGFSVIFTCSGSHKFLLERGIVPTYHIDSDPRTHKVAMLGTPNPNVTYLIASICHPTYFDLLERYEIPKVLLWHILFFEPEIYANYPKGELLLTGGNTVGPRAIKMARMLGYTDLHFFGFDASAGYAGYHKNAPTKFRPCEYDGKTYWTTYNLVEHAKMLFADLDRMPDVKMHFYGDGLIQAIAKNYVRPPRAPLPMGVVACHPNLVYQTLRRQNGSR